MHPRPRFAHPAWKRLLPLLLLPQSLVWSASDGAGLYETRIRPILRAHCTHCHGEEANPGGGIDLRLRRFMNGKTEDGEALLTPGRPDQSALLRVIREGEMPKKGKKLSAAELAVLEEWVRSGAETTEPEPESLPAGAYIAASDRKHWAFQPVRNPEPPRFADAQELAPIDAFVRERLMRSGLDFAPEADRATLLRRVHLDLSGLPPSPEETAAFVADKNPDAFAQRVDALLASPAYGERWARHWLDVAGYSDSNGYADTDSVRPHIWRYRDYVIRAFNADKPWDRFIQEQLAGDELAGVSHGRFGDVLQDPEKFEALAATGFLRLGPDGTGDAVPDANLARNQSVADTLRIVTSSLMGLTVACAQCHDHRYDPVSQADYYRLRAVFDPALDWRKWRTPAQRLASLYTREDREKAAEIEKQAAQIDAEAKKIEKDFLDGIFEEKILQVPEAEREPYRMARATEKTKRTPEQEALLKKYPSALALYSLNLYDPKKSQVVADKRSEATKLRATKPVEGMLSVLTEVAGQIPVSQVHHRGDHEQLREEVAPGEISVLGNPDLSKPEPSLATSGRRLAYARWLTSGSHPLVGRALMNRVWMHHFGRGIVSTPGDFGKLGEAPSHPELLDYLATRFVAAGWSLKAMHREMVLSRTYRQSSHHAASVQRDPENVWLGRFRVRRLDAEAIRDAMLSVAGVLQPEAFGPPVAMARSKEGRIVAGIEILNVNGDVTKVDTSAPAVNRRSIYLQMRRKLPATVLESFDLPVMDPNCEIRAASTVAPQALFLMNDEFIQRVARSLAERVRNEHSGDMRAQVRRAWTLTQGRTPSEDEQSQFLLLLSEQTEQLRDYASKQPPTEGAPAADPSLEALASLCQALLSSNRMLHTE